MKTIGVIGILGLLGLAACAEMPEPFPGYDDVCGLAIRDTPYVHRDRLASVYTYLSGPKRGYQFIGVSEDLNEPGNETLRAMFIAYECGHYVLGHLPTIDYRGRLTVPREVSHRHVLEADCWAAKTLAKAGVGDSELAFRILRNAPESDTHPSGRDRIENIKRCLGSN